MSSLLELLYNNGTQPTVHEENEQMPFLIVALQSTADSATDPFHAVRLPVPAGWKLAVAPTPRIAASIASLSGC